MPRFVITMEKRKKHNKDKRREFVEVEKRITVFPSKKKYNRRKEKRNETRI